MRVSELMSREVVTIGIHDTCDEALARMVGRKVRHLPVLGEDGKVRGVVTDRDLRHHLFAPEVFRQVGSRPLTGVLRERPVREVMSAPAVCISAVADLEDAARLMRQYKIGSVPVLEGGRVVGVLTETDLLRHIVRAEDRTGPELDVIVSYP